MNAAARPKPGAARILPLAVALSLGSAASACAAPGAAIREPPAVPLGSAPPAAMPADDLRAGPAPPPGAASPVAKPGDDIREEAAPPPGAAPRAGIDEGLRERVLEAARRRVGRPFRGDCSGFVLTAFREAGISLTLRRARSRSESIHLATLPTENPRPGDVAFFDHTYDRNHDGRANDLYTHVALVEAVDGPAVTLIHRGHKGVERIRMDPARPSDPAANDRVRFLRRGDGPRTRVLAGELFSGYGTVPLD